MPPPMSEDRGKHRYRRLANGHDIKVWAECAEDAHDAIIEFEVSFGQGHIAGIRPICDVDAVVRVPVWMRS